MASSAAAAPPHLPRIVLIDHYDSYTLNSLQLLIPNELFASSLDSTAGGGTTFAKGKGKGKENGKRSDWERDRESQERLLQRWGDEVARKVVVIKGDQFDWDTFKESILPFIDCIIISPGPGRPDRTADFGFCERLLREVDVPVLGICLGHQGLASAFGGRVARSRTILHGQPVRIQHSGQGIFQAGVPQDFEAIRYNSLTVVEESLPTELEVIAWTNDEAGGGRAVMGLRHRTRPLWGVQYHPESISSHCGHRLMRNFLDLVDCFWKDHPCPSVASRPGTQTNDTIPASILAHSTIATPQRLSAQTAVYRDAKGSSANGPREGSKVFSVIESRFHLGEGSMLSGRQETRSVFERLFRRSPAGHDRDSHRGVSHVWLDSSREGDPHSRYSYMATPSWVLSYDTTDRRLWLHVGGASSSHHAPDSSPPLIDGHSSGGVSGAAAMREDLPIHGPFWGWLDCLQRQLHRHTTFSNDEAELDEDGRAKCVFRTGFVGLFGYEMKTECLAGYGTSTAPDLATEPCSNGQSSIDDDNDRAKTPDAVFAFCDKVLAFDHMRNLWIAKVLVRHGGGGEEEPLSGPLNDVQRALANRGAQIGVSDDEAQAWLRQVSDELRQLHRTSQPAGEAHAGHLFGDTIPVSFTEAPAPAPARPSNNKRAITPVLRPDISGPAYRAKIDAARVAIGQGESYELCLTNKFRGRLVDEEDVDPYELYVALRDRNPAPYSAYLDFPFFHSPEHAPFTVLSTSPERFVSVDRGGRVEAKPIKGTVARAKGGTSEWRAEEDERRWRMLEQDRKERGENLMIVDLIRADLLSFCPVHSVLTPRLMKVETYETVHQLVTTVVAQLASGVGTVEAVERCFPPGSMTGAPKLRSVQILERLEGQRRGVYSGCLGFLSLDGAADFSVVIRTLVLQARELSLGAGGAITWLSDRDGEWEEVLQKATALVGVEGITA